MAATSSNAAVDLFADFDTSDLVPPAPAASTAASAPKAVDPASIAWDDFATDDLIHRDTVDYGNGAYGAPGANTGVISPDGSPPSVNLAGKRDLGEKAGTYAELNKGLGGQYSPFIQGTSFGSFDELSSAGLAPLDALANYLQGSGPTTLSEAYDQRKAEYLRDRALYEEEAPLTALGGELAGNLLSGGAGAKIVANAPGYGSMLLRAAGVGAAETGAYSALDTEGTLLDRLKAGTQGAVLGGSVGVAAPLLGSGVAALGRGVVAGKNATVDGLRRFFNPAAGAEADFVRQAARDRVNFETASRKAAADGKPAPERDFGTDEDALDAFGVGQGFDVGDLAGRNARRMAREGLEADPDAAELLARRAESRQSDQGQRASELVQDMFEPVAGVRSGLNPAQTIEELKRRAQVANRANYRAAFDNPATQDLWRAGIRGMTGSDAVKKAFADAAREHSEDLAAEVARGGSGVAGATSIGRTPAFRAGADGMLDLDPSGGKVSLRFLDRVQKKLGDQIEAAKGPNGKMTHEATRLSGFRKLLLENMDDASIVDGTSLYGAARGTARAFFDTDDAFSAGMKMATGRQGAMDLSAAREAIATYTEPERALFARGYAATMLDRISKLPDGKDVAALLNNKSARENLRAALGDENAARFEAYLFRDGVSRQLGDMAKAAAKKSSDSAAARRIEQALSIGGGFAFGSMFDDEWGGGGGIAGALFGAAGRGVWAKVSASKRRQYAQALSQLMSSSEPNDIARIHARIMADADLARLHSAAASRGVLGVARDSAGLVAREAPGAAAQVAAAGGTQVPQINPADREARVPAAAEGEQGFAEGGVVRRLEAGSDLYSPTLATSPAGYDAAAAEESMMRRYLAGLSQQQRESIAARLTPQSLQELVDADAYQRPKLSGRGVGLVTKGDGVVQLAEGGLVSGAAGSTYFDGEQSLPQGGEPTPYDAKGATPPRPMKRLAASAGRRDNVAMGSRSRSRPERARVQQAAPPSREAMAREFWSNLKSAMTDHAYARGLDISGVNWPLFDDEPTTAAVVAAEPIAVEVEETVVTTKPAMPPRAPLDEDIARAAAKRRAKREAEGRSKTPKDVMP